MNGKSKKISNKSVKNANKGQKRNFDNKKQNKRYDEAAKDRHNSAVSRNSNCHTSNVNDPVWYGSDTQLGRDAASVSFGNILGKGLPLTGSIGDIDLSNIYRTPGIMTFTAAPVYGISKDQNSALNLAARQLYQQVRVGQSGATNYDTPDLMLYILAMDNMYSMLAWLKRTYGIINTFSKVNAYHPQRIVEALGFNYTNLVQNLASFRAFINTFALKLSSFNVPRTMPIFVRHQWLFEGFYVDDSNNDKCQYYAFRPAGFYKYQETSGEPGYLEWKAINQSNLLTYAQIVSFVDDMFNAIGASQDMITMRGDIQKAFGDNLVTVSGITEDFEVRPSYVSDVAAQINNMTVVKFDPSTMNITQDPTIGHGNPLIFDPRWAGDTSGAPTPLLNNYVLNLMDNDTSPARIMEATRLLTPWVYDEENDLMEFITCSSEVISDIKIWNMDDVVSISAPILRSDTLSSAYNAMQKLAAASVFDNHPTLYWFDEVGLSIYPITDLKQFTWIDATTVKKINDIALLFLFNVGD